jgi:hypothetical protein
VDDGDSGKMRHDAITSSRSYLITSITIITSIHHSYLQVGASKSFASVFANAQRGA